MRKIKFRGQDICGHYVYGLLTKKKIRNSGNLEWAIVDGHFTQGETIPVIENSIAQLVGYDADNAEVYEGDVLVSESGHEYIATLDSMLLWTKDPNIKYWHVPLNQSDDETLPTSSNKLLWDFYKNCCEKMTHTKFLRLKKE